MKAKPWTKAERQALDYAFSSLLRRAEKMTVKRLGERVVNTKPTVRHQRLSTREFRKVRRALNLSVLFLTTQPKMKTRPARVC